jgi:outer membrane receptor for ferrienterochelin and colicin
VLYGADAFSGVINIILKTPAELAAESKKGSVVGQFERHDTQFAEGIYTTVSKDKTLDTTFGYGYHGTTGAFAGQPNVEKDSSSVPIYTFDTQKQMPRGSLEFSLDTATAKADLASEVLVRGGTFNSGTGALTYIENRGANPLTLRYYESVFHEDDSVNSSHTKSGEFDIQQIRPLSPGSSLTYGGSYRNADVKSNLTGSGLHSGYLKSYFLQDQDQIGSKTTLFAGLRDDDQSIYGSQISTKLSAVHHLTANHTLRLSYGTAFRAPTFLENYVDLSYPVAPGLNAAFLNNTTLKPEQIASTEAGYRIDYGSGFAGINVFYNHISDLILPTATEFAPAPYPAGIPIAFRYENTGSAHCEGLELEGGSPLSHGWSALANYSYEDARDQQGNLEDYSPQDKANLILQSDPKQRVSTKIAYHYVSSTNSSDGPLRAYMTVDARLAYRLGKSQNAWTAAISTINLLDDHHREYLDAAGTSPILDISEAAQRSVRIELNGKF